MFNREKNFGKKNMLKAFEENVQEMEHLKSECENQNDWQDDSTNQIRGNFYTKERNTRAGRFCSRGRVQFRKCFSYGNCDSHRSPSPSSDGDSSPSHRGRRYRRGRNYGHRGSVSEGEQRVYDLTAPNLAKCIAEFDGFQATLLQLYDKFNYDYKHMEQIANRNTHSFIVDKELIQLRPQVNVCSSHLAIEGCDEPESCNCLHICLKYAMGKCEDKDCLYGHLWHTNHNKPILYNYNLNFLKIRSLFKLFQTIILPELVNGELEICEKYNEETCDDRDCSRLHMCLNYLAKKCSDKDCKLVHNVFEQNVSTILQMHGLSLNEAPRDIMISIINFPKVKEIIESLTVAQSGNDDDLTDKRGESEEKEESVVIKNKTETADKTKELKTESVLNKENDRSEESVLNGDVPLKTVWSHDLLGNVTINEICYDSVEGFCSYEESGCWRLHCPYHFHWQIKAPLGKKTNWVNLTKEQDYGLEKAYCNPSIQKTELPLLDPIKFGASDKGLLLTLKGRSKWKADFSTMKISLLGKTDILELRRLCTEKTINITPTSCEWKWYFLDINKKWIEYGNLDSSSAENLRCDVNSDFIEDFYQRQFLNSLKSSLDFKNKRFSYVLDFSRMIQINQKTGAARSITRRPALHLEDEEKAPKSDLPLNWELMQPEERLRRVTLAPSTSEYQIIDNHFRKHAPLHDYTILKIERIQNPYLFRAFHNKIQEIKVTYEDDAKIDIRYLFHGTGPDIVQKICEENFDWRLHGTSSGQAYGRGTYFSTSSAYSAKYTEEDAYGRRYMFVAKVAVGTTTIGNPSMSTPPNNQRYNRPYDSTVDQVSRPKIIVKYDKQEYFPEYIITFD